MSSNVHKLAETPLRERVSSEEWEVRVNLAACYRLAAHSTRPIPRIGTDISASRSLAGGDWRGLWLNYRASDC